MPDQETEKSKPVVYPTIDIRTIQLKYFQFNVLYFENKLPRNIEFGTFKSRSICGEASVSISAPVGSFLPKGNRENRNAHLLGITIKEPYKLKISTSYKMTQEQFDGIMLHEMAHIKNVHDGFVWQSHGYIFQDLIKDLSRKSGINIPVTEGTDDLELSESEAGKEKRVMAILYYYNNKTYVYMFSPEAFNGIDPSNYREHFIKDIASTFESGARMELWDTKTNMINGLRLAKSIPKTSLRFISAGSGLIRSIVDGKKVADAPTGKRALDLIDKNKTAQDT